MVKTCRESIIRCIAISTWEHSQFTTLFQKGKPYIYDTDERKSIDFIVLQAEYLNDTNWIMVEIVKQSDYDKLITGVESNG